jgi:hypothetical protein
VYFYSLIKKISKTVPKHFLDEHSNLVLCNNYTKGKRYKIFLIKIFSEIPIVYIAGNIFEPINRSAYEQIRTSQAYSK